jgi:hypothetical protein
MTGFAIILLGLLIGMAIFISSNKDRLSNKHKKILSFIYFGVAGVFMLFVIGSLFSVKMPGYNHKKDKIVNEILNNHVIHETYSLSLSEGVVLRTDEYELTIRHEFATPYESEEEWSYVLKDINGDYIHIQESVFINRRDRLSKKTYEILKNYLKHNSILLLIHKE